MPKQWNLQDAKARLSELVDRAQIGDAQVILRRGKPAAVLVSYDSFASADPPEQSILSFFEGSPVRDVDFDVPRPAESLREI